MKTRVMTATLLIAVASISAYAQSSSKLPDRRPTPTAGELPSSTSSQSSQTTMSGQKNSSTKGSGSTSSQSGSGKTGKLSAGKASGQGSTKQEGKASRGPVNQQAAGVPNKGSAAKLRTGQTSNNQ